MRFLAGTDNPWINLQQGTSAQQDPRLVHGSYLDARPVIEARRQARAVAAEMVAAIIAVPAETRAAYTKQALDTIAPGMAYRVEVSAASYVAMGSRHDVALREALVDELLRQQGNAQAAQGGLGLVPCPKCRGGSQSGVGFDTTSSWMPWNWPRVIYDAGSSVKGSVIDPISDFAKEIAGTVGGWIDTVVCNEFVKYGTMLGTSIAGGATMSASGPAGMIAGGYGAAKGSEAVRGQICAKARYFQQNDPRIRARLERLDRQRADLKRKAEQQAKDAARALRSRVVNKAKETLAAARPGADHQNARPAAANALNSAISEVLGPPGGEEAFNTLSASAEAGRESSFAFTVEHLAEYAEGLGTGYMWSGRTPQHALPYPGRGLGVFMDVWGMSTAEQQLDMLNRNPRAKAAFLEKFPHLRGFVEFDHSSLPLPPGARCAGIAMDGWSQMSGGQQYVWIMMHPQSVDPVCQDPDGSITVSGTGQTVYRIGGKVVQPTEPAYGPGGASSGKSSMTTWLLILAAAAAGGVLIWKGSR